MLKKIAITGPESTGKSILCEQLAKHYQTLWVPEFAREYIDQLDSGYEQSDILTIAKNQLKLEEETAANSKQFLFCDTELIVCKIWSNHKYQNCDPWILNQIKESDYHLYLLCNIDLPWVSDPQREHPDLRKYFFDKYRSELEHYNFNYKIVSGTGPERIHNAITLITASL